MRDKYPGWVLFIFVFILAWWGFPDQGWAQIFSLCITPIIVIVFIAKGVSGVSWGTDENIADTNNGLDKIQKKRGNYWVFAIVGLGLLALFSAIFIVLGEFGN